MLVPMRGAMMRRCRDIVGLCGRALVLLRGAHGSHRHFEAGAGIQVRRRGQLWSEDGERNDGEELEGRARRVVHDDVP